VTALVPQQVDVAPLLRRLQESQIDATVESDGSIHFEGVSWMPHVGEGVDQSWDRLVGEHLLNRLAEAASHAIAESSWMSPTITVAPQVVVLASGPDTERIVVSATRAVQCGKVVGRSRNYLVDGRGWLQLHKLLHPVLADYLFLPAQPGRIKAEPPVDSPRLQVMSERHRLWDPLPTGFRLTDVLLAGIELAEERAHELPAVAELASEDSTIWVWPTTVHRGELVLPMRVYDREVEVDLALEVDSTIPPPLWVAPNLDIPGLMDIWALATLAARELLTSAEALVTPVPRNAKPTPETVRLLRDSRVIGHRRKLGPDESASSDAIREASRLRIRLDSAHTWVRPHTRGLTAAGTLRYTWNCDSLRMSLRTGSLRRTKDDDGR
jgi:hypothetical protein